MRHPVLRGLQVRAARPCLRALAAISKPIPPAVAMQGRSPQGQWPATCHRLGKSLHRGWDSLTAPPPTSPSLQKDSVLPTFPRPSLPSSSQVLLLGAPPTADSAGTSKPGQHLQHLPGHRGKQNLLQNHGVPCMPRRPLPPTVHPETGSARWQRLPMPVLPEPRRVHDGNAHHGDPTLQEVGFSPPRSQGVKHKCSASLRTAPAGLATFCPMPLALSSTEELETGQAVEQGVPGSA